METDTGRSILMSDTHVHHRGNIEKEKYSVVTDTGRSILMSDTHVHHSVNMGKYSVVTGQKEEGHQEGEIQCGDGHRQVYADV